MASNPVRLTPLAQLLDTALKAGQGISLGTYLAIRRTPGPAWQTFDEIAAFLSRLTDRPLNRVTIKNFAHDLYSLPDTRYQKVGGKPKSMPGPVETANVEAYLTALADLPAGSVDVGDVRAHAYETTEDATAAPDTVTASA